MPESKVVIPEAYLYEGGGSFIDALLIRQDGSAGPKYYEHFLWPGFLDLAVWPGQDVLFWSNDMPQIGMRAGEPICVLVHNGDESPARFNLRFEVSEQTNRAYEAAPPEALDWCWLGGQRRSEAFVDLDGFETVAIPIGLSIPSKADLPKFWELDLSVVEVFESELFVTEFDVGLTRIYVAMQNMEASLPMGESILWAG